MLLKMAWRNIFRNKRRSFIAAAAISMGLTTLIFIDALQEGVTINMVKSATASFMGESQIHFKSFTDALEVEKTIKDPDKIMKEFAKDKLVKDFSPRIKTMGMITSPGNVQPLIIMGVDPQKEKALSKIDDAMIKGEYLKNDNEKGIILGTRLAKMLEVEVGDRLVITVAQANTGEIFQKMMRLKGIFKLGIRKIDSSIALVSIKRAAEMLALKGEVHEIAVNFKNHRKSWDKNLPVWKKYSQNENVFKSWRKLMPQMEAMLSAYALAKYINALILFLLVAGVIVNTLFMSIYERMFEFGVMKAMGFKPFKTGLLVIFESGILAVFATLIGIVTSLIVCSIFLYYGFDFLTGAEYASITIIEVVYPVMSIEQYSVFPVALIIFSMITGIYPAVHAARIRPNEAMKKI